MTSPFLPFRTPIGRADFALRYAFYLAFALATRAGYVFLEDPALLMTVVVLHLIFFVFILASTVGRILDTGWSLWTMLLLLVPFANFIFVVLLLIKRGEPGLRSSQSEAG